MKVALVTQYYDNYLDLANVTLPNWRGYCERHGYELYTHVGDYGYTGDTPIGFHKVKFLYDTLFIHPNPPDLAWCLDLDIIITNLSTRLEDLAAHGTRSYLATSDVNGINCGSVLVRRTDGAKELLEYILSMSRRISNDQDCIKHFPDNEVVKRNVEIIEHPYTNSYLYQLYPDYAHHAATNPGQWKNGHFALHLPGLSLSRRLEVLNSDLFQISS